MKDLDLARCKSSLHIQEVSLPPMHSGFRLFCLNWHQHKLETQAVRGSVVTEAPIKSAFGLEYALRGLKRGGGSKTC